MLEPKQSFSFFKRDPLVILGLAILVTGVLLATYGFIPQMRPEYQLIASGSVPINDTTGNFISDPETYFQAHNVASGTLNLIRCYPSVTGWTCYGYKQIGTSQMFNVSSRNYGLIMVFAGLASIYAGNRLSPLKPKPPHLRPIRVRVDENICVSNSVCISLAPTVFRLRSQDAPTLFAPTAFVFDPNGADNDTIIQAAEMCPTGAIIVEDAETGERIHPLYPKN